MHCSSADASFLVKISSCFPLIRNQQLHYAFHSDNSAVALLVFQVLFISAGISLATVIERSAGSLVISSADHSNDIVLLYTYLKDLATGFLSCDWFLFVATGAVQSAGYRGYSAGRGVDPTGGAPRGG
ncbi:hypothetical protein F511_14606 [Dorcoceras hygrometricum]|uniref:Uncharacterized protein n=1 Tax=Dorcoceras hygrometricum TaxID=472368 RepID=A0A2Z7CUX1_9LAMI|nr:hypothetical protein F511_14606 [Dorcoceras hygrometricum]